MFKMWNRGFHANLKVKLTRTDEKWKVPQTGYKQGKKRISTACPQKVQNVEQVVEEQQSQEQYVQETTFEKKPSLWQRIKNSKVVRAIRYAMKIKVVLQYPALPEGRGENY